MGRGVRYTIPPNIVKLLQNYYLMSRERQFSLSVGPDKPVILHWKTTYTRIFMQRELILKGLFKRDRKLFV